MAGYIRQDTTNNIADGNVINASDFDNEYNAIEAAFHAATGHTHDGTSAEGAPITKIGPTQDVVASTTALTPKTDNTVDLGSSTLEYKDLYIDGTANIDSLVADTADINAGTIDGVTIGGASAGAGTFTTVAATTGNITTVNATTVDATNVEVTNIKAKDGTASASIADSTGAFTVSAAFAANGNTTLGDAVGDLVTVNGTTTFANANPTLSAGTANGVLYLDGSKVATSGSALTFDGTNLGLTSGGYFNLSGDTFINNGKASFYYEPGTTTWINIKSPSVGALSWNNSGGELMRLTSTGLGIGTSSPGSLLDVAGGVQATGAVMRLTNSASSSSWVAGDVVGAVDFYSTDASFPGTKAQIKAFADTGNGTTAINYSALSFSTMFNGAFAEQMRLDASGNLGLGVTPSAWSGSGVKAFDVGTGASFTGSGSDAGMIANAYFNGTNWIYKTSSRAVRYQQLIGTGTHAWYTAPSGTAGDAISFTQSMTLDASGNLGIGTTSPQRSLHVNGSTGAMRLQGTSVGGYIEIVGPTTTNFIGTPAAISSGSTTDLGFYLNGLERARITSGGNFKIGGTADRATTEGDKQLVLFEGTAPVGTLANGISIYSTSGEAYVMDAAGNATLFSPHDAETNEWIFRSKHTPTGKVLKIDVERLLKFVNDHFGLDAVHEFIEP